MTTLMTPETAPRDAAALTKVGPFVHRRLGEALEQQGFRCWTNDREKTAFVTASPEDRAQALLTQLLAFDAARGGAPAQAAPPPPPPVQQAAPPPAQAAPPAAPPAGTTPSGRSPRTAPSAGAAAAANGAAAAGGAGQVLELLTAVKAVQDLLQTVNANVSTAAAAAGQAQAGAGNLMAEVQALKGMVAASMKIQEVELGLLCLYGEQVLQAPMGEFLKDSIAYGSNALAQLGELGKAAG